jgi:hypothetical protein
VDYEGPDYLLDTKEIEYILNQITNTLILTVAIRANEFQEEENVWNEYLKLFSKHDNLSFCLVPGHENYKINKKISTRSAFHGFFTTLRREHTKSIFMGIENLSSQFVGLILSTYDGIVPILLNGDNRLLRKYPEISLLGNRTAVYSPFITKTTDYSSIMEKTIYYLLRRNYTRNLLAKTSNWQNLTLGSEWDEISSEIKEVLRKSLDRFVLTDHNIQRYLFKFKQYNVQLVIGFPLSIENIAQEIKNFSLKVHTPSIPRKNLKIHIESSL